MTARTAEEKVQIFAVQKVVIVGEQTGKGK